MPALMPHVREGRFRALAVGSAERITYVPGLETVPSMGELLPGKGVDAQVWYATMAPAGTPEPVLSRLHAAISQVAKAPGIRRAADPARLPAADGCLARGLRHLLARRGGAVGKTLVEISGAQAE